MRILHIIDPDEGDRYYIEGFNPDLEIEIKILDLNEPVEPTKIKTFFAVSMSISEMTEIIESYD